ncbi:matrixin family metalloprotease [Erythrobacter aureus]|uniref:matrixin family metalloprotease n=1 Tax=Erythrobacter aureus TaxID=2182384 RepID=UPI003A92B0CA
MNIKNSLAFAAIGVFALQFPANASAQSTLGMFGKFEKGSMSVALDDAFPVECLWAAYYGIEQYNNYFTSTNNFRLYYGGTVADHPPSMSTSWRPDYIDVLNSAVAGYTYKGYTYSTSTLGFANHVYKAGTENTSNPILIDGQVYENASYFYYGTGTPGAYDFDCDRADGTTGIDYQSHVMHEIGHVIGLKHTPGTSTYSNCMMTPIISSGTRPDWCSIEGYTLGVAYGNTDDSGLVYASPLSGAETQ